MYSIRSHPTLCNPGTIHSPVPASIGLEVARTGKTAAATEKGEGAAPPKVPGAVAAATPSPRKKMSRMASLTPKRNKGSAKKTGNAVMGGDELEREAKAEAELKTLRQQEEKEMERKMKMKRASGVAR
jgi:hypothetical protein